MKHFEAVLAVVALVFAILAVAGALITFGTMIWAGEPVVAVFVLIPGAFFAGAGYFSWTKYRRKRRSRTKR